MENSHITLSEVIEHIDSGMPFSMTYITADRRTGTGGHIKQVKNWVRCQLDALPEVILRKNKALVAETKNPKHSIHKTRNIMDTATRTIKKVHLRLITEFQGKRVV